MGKESVSKQQKGASKHRAASHLLCLTMIGPAIKSRIRCYFFSVIFNLTIFAVQNSVL